MTMLMNSSTMSPPTITMANGLCESEPMSCDMRRQKAQGGDQHGHHDRAKAQKSAFLGGFTRAHAARPELVMYRT